MDALAAAPTSVHISNRSKRRTTMEDERKPQDSQDDPKHDTQDKSKQDVKPTEELSDEQLGTIAGGAVNAFVSFFDKADGESIQKELRIETA
jgi:hypothetical protein